MTPSNVALGLELLIQLTMRLQELATAIQKARSEDRTMTDEELQPFADAAGTSLNDLRAAITAAQEG